jgi:hypothetical protein
LDGTLVPVFTGHTLSEEHKRKIGEASSQLVGELNGAYGKRWIHNVELQQTKFVNKNELNEYLGVGWVVGRKFDFSNKAQNCTRCSKEISLKNKTKMCNACNQATKFDISTIPTLQDLLESVDTLGYLGTGRKYSVSDTTIRKWIKKHNNTK